MDNAEELPEQTYSITAGSSPTAAARREVGGHRTEIISVHRLGQRSMALPVFRRCAQLRERLVPYLPEQARTTITTGRPLMRALFFDYRDDPKILAPSTAAPTR